MTNLHTDSATFLSFLERALEKQGWMGRMYGAKHFLRFGALVNDVTKRLSVVSIRRGDNTPSPFANFAKLEKEAIPFQGILVDVLADGDAIPSHPQPGVDVQLAISNQAPWYTAFNLGAACACGDILIFLDGTTTPQPGLLAAYDALFSGHPETLAARGVVLADGLDNCACNVTGSFVLDPATGLWPVDLDENMAVQAGTFFAMGGFDESLEGGYGALEYSIRLFGHKPDFNCQRYASQAITALEVPQGHDLPLANYLMQRQRSWLQLNESMKRYLELYGKFWIEHTEGQNHD